MGDDECACGEIALNLGVFGECELVSGEEWSLYGAIDDDFFSFDGGVAVCTVSDVYFALGGDFAFEVAQDAGRFFEEHLAFDCGVCADDGHFWRVVCWCCLYL